MLVVLLILAAALRFYALSSPPSFIFDETYYAKDSCLYVGLPQTTCGTGQATEQSWVHPPLGKWVISGGIKIFGYDSFGWRVSAALAGIGLVALTFLLARRIFRSTWVAGVSGLLATGDFLLLVQSRVAMLDIFLAFFVMAGFLLMSLDRERVLLLDEHLHLPFPGSLPSREMEWRFAAGAMFGMAAAVKWSGVLALAGAGALAVGWSAALHLRARRASRGIGISFRREMILSFAALVAVPVVVYLTSYSLWFSDNIGREHCKNAKCATGIGATLIAYKDLQAGMLNYHWTLKATHSYESKAWTWPLVTRPVLYHYTAPPDAPAVHQISAMGNPLVWWPALAGAVWLGIRAGRWGRPEQLVGVAWGAQYLPWLLVRRALFIFYMTPVVPFMLIGLAATLERLRHRGPAWRRAVTIYLLVAAVFAVIYFFPILAGTPLHKTPDCGPFFCWESRIWLGGWI